MRREKKVKGRKWKLERRAGSSAVGGLGMTGEGRGGMRTSRCGVGWGAEETGVRWALQLVWRRGLGVSRVRQRGGRVLCTFHRRYTGTGPIATSQSQECRRPGTP